MAKSANKKTIKTKRSTSDLLRDKLKKEQQKSSEAEFMNQALVSSIGEGVVIVNEYGHITSVNDNALTMLGYVRKDLEGAWLPLVLPSIDKTGAEIPSVERPVMQSLLTGQPTSSTVRYLKKDGTTIPIFTTAAPFLVKDKPRGAIILFRDISQEMKIEQAKDEFISITSHQLRTPLTAIQLFTQLLKDPLSGELNEAQRDYLDKIQLSAERLLLLVTDFLNISKLELGELKPDMSKADIITLINDQIKEIRPLLDESGVSLSFAKPAKAISLETDPKLLSQVIHNLLTNAVRYTKSGSGRIIVHLKHEPRGLRLSVADNGIGIAEDAKAQIFERLFRAENARSYHAEGHGLGLYLVKKIVEALNGKIWFKSQEGKGTTFYVLLPSQQT